MKKQKCIIGATELDGICYLNRAELCEWLLGLGRSNARYHSDISDYVAKIANTLISLKIKDSK